MKDECFLIFTNNTNKEVSIGLKGDAVNILYENIPLPVDREKMHKGTLYKMKGELYKFIGYECNKIPTNTLPQQYKRSRTVMRNSRGTRSFLKKSKKINTYLNKVSPKLVKSKSMSKKASPKVVGPQLRNYEKAAQFLKNNWAPK